MTSSPNRPRTVSSPCTTRACPAARWRSSSSPRCRSPVVVGVRRRPDRAARWCGSDRRSAYEVRAVTDPQAPPARRHDRRGRRLARQRRGAGPHAPRCEQGSRTSGWSPAAAAAPAVAGRHSSVDDALRASVHTPAGLDIGARTPRGGRAVDPRRDRVRTAARRRGPRDHAAPPGRSTPRRRPRPHRHRPGLRHDRWLPSATSPHLEPRGPGTGSAAPGAGRRSSTTPPPTRREPARGQPSRGRGARGPAPGRRRPARRGWTRSTTSPTRALATALFCAARLRQPVLLEGEPGVGKTEAAKSLAAVLRHPAGAAAVLRGHRRWPRRCTSGTTRGSCWHPAGRGARRDAGRGRPVRPTSSWSRDRCSPRCEHPGPRPAVLLIDEVDRADDDFEAFLLELLGRARRSPSRSSARSAPPYPPIVVLTSNRTRDLHDALKRRCLYHWIDYPRPRAQRGDRPAAGAGQLRHARAAGGRSGGAAAHASTCRSLRASPRRSTGSARWSCSASAPSMPTRWTARWGRC